MKIFDQYVAELKAKFTDPSPAMVAYIKGLETIEAEAYRDDMGMADRSARWNALSEDEQIACQVLCATL